MAKTYPGVYVEEVSSGVHPITTASTSTAAFIGMAEKGPTDEAVKVYNFTEYQIKYGGFIPASKLSHAVLQYFINGGSQCYIVRVVGINAKAANIVLKDRGTNAQASLTISANSKGSWGNKLALRITNGTNDSNNEFNIEVYMRDESGTPQEKLETLGNLSMISSIPNFVNKVAGNSKYIKALVNAGNTNVGPGSSLGAEAPDLTNLGVHSKFRINIDCDGYQEVDINDGVGTGTGQAANLNSIANAIIAIKYAVGLLTRKLVATSLDAFTGLICTLDSGKLLLTSATVSLSSSVSILPPSDATKDATPLLKLGKLQRGIETIGGAVTRPINTQNNSYYFIENNAVTTAGPVSRVQGGLDDDAASDQCYIDTFNILDNLDDVSLIAVPGIGSAPVVGAGLNYCDNRPLKDCFFIGEMSEDDNTVPFAQAFQTSVNTKNSYGAVYLPWIKTLDPTGKSVEPIAVPPSGFVAGLYAKTDAQRGVWKAPAGTSVALGGAIVGLAKNFTDVEQGNLNPLNINVIRKFSGAGVVIWGARTISTPDSEYNYVPVRRTAIMLRVSIYRGIQWAVFEPNDEELWASLRLNINSFMMTLYRQGAFQGTTPSQAFFVKCDSETTTQDDINLGIVNVLIGFAPLRPAEFIVVKISQKAGQSS